MKTLKDATVTMLPTPFVAMRVAWGEKEQHLYCDDPQCGVMAVQFFKTDREAQEFVNQQCAKWPHEWWLILRAERICKADIVVKAVPVSSITPRDLVT